MHSGFQKKVLEYTQNAAISPGIYLRGEGALSACWLACWLADPFFPPTIVSPPIFHHSGGNASYVMELYGVTAAHNIDRTAAALAGRWELRLGRKVVWTERLEHHRGGPEHYVVKWEDLEACHRGDAG
jgi:hypothetical protein